MKAKTVIYKTTLIFVTTLIVVSIKVGAQLDDVRLCNANETAVITVALKEAKTGIDRAINIVEAITISSQPKYERWFGDQNAGTSHKVRETYLSTKAFADFQTYYCPLSNTPELDLDHDTVATVGDGTDITAMYFTPLFFDQPSSGGDSRMGIIVHELTHYTLTGSTGDDNSKYGIIEAELRATNDPELAAQTADNYQYLVEDILFGI